MDIRIASGCALALALMGGCREKNEVAVTETRQTATCDDNFKLFATSDERFRNARPCPVTGEPPTGWSVLPASESRLLNYRFGPSGTGCIWVATAEGSVAESVNRWRRQMGAKPLAEAEIQGLRRVPILGASGVWVQAEGNYASGTGIPAKAGYGLAGVITEFRGLILSVQMVAPAAEVRFGIPALEAFVKSLRPVE